MYQNLFHSLLFGREVCSLLVDDRQQGSKRNEQQMMARGRGPKKCHFCNDSIFEWLKGLCIAIMQKQIVIKIII